MYTTQTSLFVPITVMQSKPAHKDELQIKKGKKNLHKST